MTLLTSWIQEPIIRLAYYEGVINTEDIEAMADQEMALYDSLQNKLYVILDTHKMTKLTANPLKTSKLTRLMKHPNLAYVLVTGNNAIGNFWLQVVSKIAGFAPTRTTRSVEESVELIHNLMRVLSTESIASKNP
jgi:hypothetical protein